MVVSRDPSLCNLDAETALAGAVLTSARAWSQVGILDPEVFATPYIRAIWRFAREKGGKITLDEVVTMLARQAGEHGRSLLDEAGGRGGLEALCARAGTDLEALVAVVKDCYTARQTKRVLERALRSFGPREEPVSPDQRIEQVLADLRQISIGAKLDLDALRRGAEAWERAFQWRLEHPGKLSGYRTFFRDVDDYVVGGLEPPNLWVVASDTGQGKSIFVAQVAAQMATREQDNGRRVKVAYFGVEMSGEEMYGRWLQGLARVEAEHIRKPHLLTEQEKRSLNQARTLVELELFPNLIYLGPEQFNSIDDLKRQTRYLAREHGVQVVVVDYLQKIAPTRARENRTDEVGDVTRGLKQLAAELDVVIVGVSQITREAGKQQYGQATLHDLAECLAGDTELVDASTGQVHRIRDLVGRTVRVFTIDEHWKLRVAEAQVWQSRVKPLYRLRTSSGRELRASAEHRLRTYDGWRPVSQLRVGDTIAVPRRLPPIELTATIAEARAEILGELIGNGNYSRWGSCRFADGDEAIVNRMAELVRSEFGIDARVRAHGNAWDVAFAVPRAASCPGCNPLINWLKTLGIHGQLGPEKAIPAEGFRQPQSVICSLLRGLFDSDGSISRATPSTWRIVFTTTSTVLARQVQHLLLRVGIRSSLATCRKRAGCLPLWRVSLLGRDSLLRFVDLVGFSGRNGEKAAWAARLARQLNGFDGRDRMPRELNAEIRVLPYKQRGSLRHDHRVTRGRLRALGKRLGVARWSELADGDVDWDEIISIEPDGEEMTYDLTVPGYQSFIANDILVHNSAHCERDADYVTTIWRPAEYLEGKARDVFKEVARVELLKGRFRARSHTYLRFDGSRARFDDLAPQEVERLRSEEKLLKRPSKRVSTKGDKE